MRTLGSIVDDMLDRIPGPYAICMDYHPALPIRGTVLKYGNQRVIEDYAAAMRQAYCLQGFTTMSAQIVTFTATREEINHVMECTGYVAALYEEKMKGAGFALAVAHAD